MMAPSIGFVFAELPRGKKTFTTIKLKGGYVYFPGKVLFYKYTAGGKPTMILKNHSFYETIGAAIGVAQ